MVKENEVVVHKRGYKKREFSWSGSNESYGREYQAKNRDQAIEALGGKCVRCGMSDSRCLQFDHINGGGTQDNKNTSAYARYKFIKENVAEAKKKFQILCANCNWIKRSENGEVRGEDLINKTKEQEWPQD